MTTPKILLVDPSETTRNFVSWSVSDYFFVLSFSSFSTTILEEHNDAALVILGAPHSQEAITAVQDAQLPLLLVVSSDTVSVYEPYVHMEKVDYLIQPFCPQDLVYRLKRNVLSPVPKSSVALFDPDGLVSSDMRARWQRSGIVLQVFLQDKPLLAFIKNKLPDLVILDAALPMHNADSLIDALKSREIPFLGLFSDYTKNIENSPVYLEADDYCIGSSEIDMLDLRLNRLLKKKTQGSVSRKIGRHTSFTESPSHIQGNGQAPALMNQVNVTLNHEIRSPLTSILIGAQVLKKSADHDSKSYQIAKEIEDASRRIQRTLDDFGQVKQVVVEDYVNGIKMLNLKRSSGKIESIGKRTC